MATRILQLVTSWQHTIERFIVAHTVLATGIAALHTRIMHISPPYYAQFTRKICECYARVKKFTELCANNYAQILHSVCKILHAEFRVKEGRIFTVVHHFVAAFSRRKCCMSNCPTGFRRMYSAFAFQHFCDKCPLWLNNQDLV